MNQINKKDLLIIVGSMLLLSLNVVISKLGMNHFPPFLFASLRFLTCLPFLYFFPIGQISITNLGIISLLWGILYLGGINLGLSLGISAGVTTLVIQLSSFITILLAAFVLKDFPNSQQIGGMLLGFLGLILVCSVMGLTVNTLGIMALGVSSLSFSIGTVFVKKLNMNPVALNVWISCVSFLPMLCLSFLFEDSISNVLISSDFANWGTVLFAGLGSMLLGGAGWAYGIKKYDLSTVAPFRLVIPVFGVIFAVVLLGESYPLETWGGALFIVLGIALSQIKENPVLFFKKIAENKHHLALSVSLAFLSASPSVAQDIIPVAIIGSGCAGLSAAMVTSEYGYRTVVFTGPLKGGDLNVQTEVGNWPGVESNMGNNIMPVLLDQARRFGSELKEETVVSVNFSRSSYQLTTDKGNTYYAQKIIIATGTQERWLNIPGMKENQAKIYYNWDIHKDLQGFLKQCEGKRIAIIGSGIDAMKKAFYATSHGAREVIIFARGAHLKMPSWRQRLLKARDPLIKIVPNSILTHVQKINDELHLSFQGMAEPYRADMIVVSIGRVPRSDLFKDYLTRDENNFICINPQTQETNIPGIFACGDVTNLTGPHPQAVIAAAAGQLAGFSCVEQLMTNE